MPQNMFPSDMFGFISGMFVIIFVIVIVFFIIVILIVYKLLHSNVDDDVKKKSAKTTNIPNKYIIKASKENTNEELIKDKKINTCKYCGEKIEDTATFCPFCGSNLTG